jgi:hypothetical protein
LASRKLSMKVLLRERKSGLLANFGIPTIERSMLEMLASEPSRISVSNI